MDSLLGYGTCGSATAPAAAVALNSAADEQGIGVHTTHAADVAGDFDRQAFLGAAQHAAAQTDQTVVGIHRDVDGVQVAAIEKTGLDLAGDPGVADHLARLFEGGLHFAATAVCRADAEVVEHLTHAIGIG